MADIITRNKKGKEVKYSKADSDKLNEFLNQGYGIEIDLTGKQQSVEQEAELKLATPINDRATVVVEDNEIEDEGR